VAAFDAFEAADQAATEVQQRVEALPPVSGVKLTVRTGFDGAPPPRDAAKPERKTAAKAAAAAPKAAAEALHLCVRYRGQAFLLDDKATFLTLGRDPENQLVIADRKASREHARIEKHDHRYVFIDSSTNGSYVVIGDAAEVMVRRDRIDLAGSGRIFFGSSGSDPNADFAEYEYL
jgi:pSer/pThr/pTyr-binding forkhead associated (FHA) protein